MNLSNLKKIFKGDNAKNLYIAGGLIGVVCCWNMVALSNEEMLSAEQVAYVAVEGLSKKVPCNGLNLLTMNMLGEKNREFISEEVRAKVMSELESAYSIISDRNTEGHSALYWWYSEWKATDKLDRVVDRCFGL